MSQHTRRILTPGASRKRKEREAFYSFKPSATTQSLPPPPPPSSSPSFPATNSSAAAATAALPDSSNRLLAGYLAYEFLTKGTLFGQKYDPARARTAAQPSAEPRKVKPEAEPSPKKEHQGYAEVANILKTDEAHIQGIVNPAQLASWIKM